MHWNDFFLVKCTVSLFLDKLVLALRHTKRDDLHSATRVQPHARRSTAGEREMRKDTEKTEEAREHERL